ncbi:MAG TPA: hypothetical protein VHC41_06750 [Mycobacteriales bacterium]|nr:hypothetical protein [Mycobacteriales bacterium]
MIGWLTRLVVVLVILGVLGYDGISLAASRAGAPDDADQAAQAAASAWAQSHNWNAATLAAQQSLTDTEVLVPGSLAISPTGAVTLRIRRHVVTLVTKDIPKAKDLTGFTVTGSASAATP